MKDVSFTLNRGEFAGLRGPNGAGKTTAIAMIMGHLTPDAGSVKIEGSALTNDCDDRKRRNRAKARRLGSTLTRTCGNIGNGHRVSDTGLFPHFPHFPHDDPPLFPRTPDQRLPPAGGGRVAMAAVRACAATSSAGRRRAGGK